MGWHDPWATTCASKLSLVVVGLSEEAFPGVLRNRKERPPVPWQKVNHLSPADAAIYQYIRPLGPQGEGMPAAVAADVEPTTP